jgi:hypothetical protein
MTFRWWHLVPVLLLLVLSEGSLLAADTSVRIIDIDENTKSRTDNARGPVPVNRVLAVVNDRVITMQDYQREHGDTVLTYGRLEPMIDRLLLQEAAGDTLLRTVQGRVDDLVGRQIGRLRRQPGGLERMLQMRGISEQELRNQLRERIKKQSLESRVLRDYFPQIQNEDTRPAYVSVRARLMYVDTLDEAWWIYRWLQDQPSETTWNTLFQEYSRKISLMGESGDLGWLHWGRFSPEIEYRIFRQPLYTVSRPFELRDGYALVYPIGYRLDPTNPEASDSLQVYRRYRRRYLLDQLYDRLRQEMNVVIPASVRSQIGK